MGRLNFRGYLISRLYPTSEIHENLMRMKNMFYQYVSVKQTYTLQTVFNTLSCGISILSMVALLAYTLVQLHCTPGVNDPLYHSRQ